MGLENMVGRLQKDPLRNFLEFPFFELPKRAHSTDDMTPHVR